MTVSEKKQIFSLMASLSQTEIQREKNVVFCVLLVTLNNSKPSCPLLFSIAVQIKEEPSCPCPLGGHITLNIQMYSKHVIMFCNYKNYKEKRSNGVWLFLPGNLIVLLKCAPGSLLLGTPSRNSCGLDFLEMNIVPSLQRCKYTTLICTTPNQQSTGNGGL